MKLPILFDTALVLGASLLHGVPAETLPPTTGRYHVGIRKHSIEFVNKDDPTSPPSHTSKEYLATIYYPTLDKPSPATPYLEPELARLLHDQDKFDVSRLTSTMRWNASFLPPHLHTGPTVLFGPAFSGPPTVSYSVLLADLASKGYVIAALDHPGEQPFLRLPDGRAIYGVDLDDDIPIVTEMHNVRVREMLHFLDFWPKLVAQLHAPFQTRNLGAVGHSLGGSCALTMALDSDLVSAAINLDGAVFGRLNASSTAADIKKPTIVFASEPHTTKADPSWKNYEAWQTGWWRMFRVKGTAHYDWSDITWWKRWGTNMTLGSIDGQRMVDLTRSYVAAFLDESLRRQPNRILDGPAREWPEVQYVGGHGT